VKRLEMNEVDGPLNVTIQLLLLLICIQKNSLRFPSPNMLALADGLYGYLNNSRETLWRVF
jgi:hypothetical protein